MKLTELYHLTERRDENDDLEDAIFDYFDDFFQEGTSGGGSIGENPNIPGFYFAMHYESYDDTMNLGKMVDTDDEDDPEIAALKQKLAKRRKPGKERAAQALKKRKENLLKALKGLEHDTSIGKFIGYDTDANAKKISDLEQVDDKTSDDLPDDEIIMYFQKT